MRQSHIPHVRDRLPLRNGYEILNSELGGLHTIIAPTPAGILQAISEFPTKARFAFTAGSTGFMIHGLLCLAVLSRRPWVRAGGVIALLQWIVYILTRGTNETVRFFAIVYPVGLVWAGGAVAWLEQSAPISQRIRNLTLIALTLFLAITYGMKQIRWGNYDSIDWPYRPILTRYDRLKYLEPKPYGLENIRLYDWVNRNTSRSAVILFADIGYPFHVRRRYHFADERKPYFPFLRDNGYPTPAEIGQFLREHDVNYVIASPVTFGAHAPAEYSLSRVSGTPVTPAHLFEVQHAN